MATVAKNRILVSVDRNTVFNDVSALTDSTVSYNQGDLLCVRSGLVQKLSAEGDASKFIGISDVTVISGKLQGPYQGLATSASVAAKGIPGPAFSVIASLILKSGDGLAAGGAVYADPADDANFVSSAGTKIIGVYQGVAITGDGVKEVAVLLGNRYPADTLAF